MWRTLTNIEQLGSNVRMDAHLKPKLRNPAATALRDRNCIQVDLDPNHSLLLTGEITQIRQFLNQLDGEHTTSELIKSFPFAERALRMLEQRGLIETELLNSQVSASLTSEQVSQLLTAQRSHQSAAGRLDFGLARLHQLTNSYLWLTGAGPATALLALLFAQQHIGRLKLEQLAEFQLKDLPFWLSGKGSAEELLIHALQRTSANLKLTQPAGMPNPDLVIIADSPWLDPEFATGYLNRNLPHLIIDARITEVTVGPLVVPGASSCLSCAEQNLAGVDRSWPVMRKLIGQHQHDQPDWLLLQLACTFAVLQVTGAIAGGDLTKSALVNQRWRFRLPGPTISIQSQPANMFCSCQWGELAA